jgi:putative permease
VFLLFISGFIVVLLLVIPIIYQEIAIFAKKIPEYQQTFSTLSASFFVKLQSVDPAIADKISSSWQTFINSIFGIFSTFANHLWSYTVATINLVAIIALVPIILYYFLKDWTKMVSSLESVLPRKDKNKIREICLAINELLSAYIRGQLNICLMLAIYYIIGLSLIGVDLALLLGLISGFLIIIPFIGAFISFFMMLISGYLTFGSGIELLYISILFVIGHGAEAYIIAPKIIGNRIGMHPIWIIFSVFAGGTLFGFVGILFAVPIAGIIKVLIQHIINYYKTSSIYNH